MLDQKITCVDRIRLNHFKSPRKHPLRTVKPDRTEPSSPSGKCHRRFAIFQAVVEAERTGDVVPTTLNLWIAKHEQFAETEIGKYVGALNILTVIAQRLKSLRVVGSSFFPGVKGRRPFSLLAERSRRSSPR
jgi:hypothetical protein